MKLFKFKYLVTLTALTLAGCAAYFSVIGLSQLFAGAGTAIVVMASILEGSKLVAASLLERYWKIISIGQKTFFSIAVGVLMCITSAGIYGLLSSGYEKTASKLGIHDTEVELINAKVENYEKNISSNTEIITTKTERVKSLSGLRDRQESRLDSLDIKSDWRSRSTANKIRKDIKIANEEIQKLNSEIDGLVITNSVLMDSVGAKKITILEKEANNEAGAELGPLKYLAELTDSDMDTVISYFILAIIIVFDPLAIALVVVANKLAMKDEKEQPKVVNTPNINNSDGTISESREVTYKHGIDHQESNDDKTPENTKEILKEVSPKFKEELQFNPEDWQIKDFEFEPKGMPEEVAQASDEVFWDVINQEESELLEDDNYWESLDDEESDKSEETTNEVSDVPFVVSKIEEPVIDPLNIQKKITENPLPLTAVVEEDKIEIPELQVVEKPVKNASEILDDKISEVEEKENKVNEIIKQTLDKKELTRRGFSVNVPKNKKPNTSIKTNIIETND